MTNPYMHSRTEYEFDTPDYPALDIPAYAVPSHTADAPYNDEQGWAPSLRISPTGVPDRTRAALGYTLPPLDGRNPAAQPPEQFYGGLDADKARRHSVEFQDADGWDETKEYPGYPAAHLGANRWARNPRETPPPEPRPTSRMAPRTYIFTRPWLQGLPKSGARNLSGLHFSMADHRRSYPILGMEPVISRRNTYRIEPGPWDINLVDMPPVNDNAPSQQMAYAPETVEIAYRSRSGRLA